MTRSLVKPPFISSKFIFLNKHTPTHTHTHINIHKYTHTHTHTHTHIYIYIYIYISEILVMFIHRQYDYSEYLKGGTTKITKSDG